MRKKNLKTAQALDKIFTTYMASKKLSHLLKVTYHATTVVFNHKGRWTDDGGGEFIKCVKLIGLYDYFNTPWGRGTNINERHLYEIQYKPQFQQYAEMDEEGLQLLFRLNDNL